MEAIKSFINGIFMGFISLIPTSGEGHTRLFKFLYVDIERVEYDTVLPLVIRLAVIISLTYFLRKDIVMLFKAFIETIKSIFNKSFSVKTDDKSKNTLYMVVFASLVFLVIPVFSKVFKEMIGNLLVTALAFLMSGILLYMSELGKRKKESEKNETPFNALSVGIFKVLSVIPGFSGLGGMYFAGLTNGFTKEFSFKFSYVLTLVAMILSFAKRCIGLFSYINVTHGILSYILAFIGALVTSYFAFPVAEKALKKEHLKYFGTYNIIIAVFIFLVWMRG